MSSESATATMDDESAQPIDLFGYEYTDHNDWFGDLVGGPQWVYFPSLYRYIDRDRGFFGKADRRLLLETHSLDLSDKTQRNARTRIRNRVLSAYFDAQFLQFMSDRDRQIVFKNARTPADGLDFREGFKEFVRFSYLGLLEYEDENGDDHEIDIAGILEQAIREAEEEFAKSKGKNASAEVGISIDWAEGADVEALERRYRTHKPLTHDELAVLVSSGGDSGGDAAEAVEIDLADAIYYDARQQESRQAMGSDRDREAAEEIVTWLRDFFAEYGVETRSDLEEAVARIKEFDQDRCDELLEKLDQLRQVAPHFEEQLAEEAKLSEEDAALLDDILWNPNDIDVEAALEKEVRPRLGDWDPSEDEDLQRFIARVEVARELGGVLAGVGKEGEQRWEEVREIAGFDDEEWTDYMDDQRIERCRSDLCDAIELESIDENLIEQADSWDEFLAVGGQTFSQFEYIYSEDVLEKAVEGFSE